MSCGEEQTGRGERGGQGGGRSRGGRRGSFRRDCIDFKLLGECERNDVGECWFSHTNKERFLPYCKKDHYVHSHKFRMYSTASVTVEIPDKVPMIMATAKRFQGLLRRKIVECCVKVADSTSVSVTIVSRDVDLLYNSVSNSSTVRARAAGVLLHRSRRRCYIV